MARSQANYALYDVHDVFFLTVTDSSRVLDILKSAKHFAREYRALTGRPLGVTGEVAEYEAVRLLGLRLADVRQSGYDAIRTTDTGDVRLQVKGRCLRDEARSGRLGKIDLEKEWDGVLMVILDENLDAVSIYEASRSAVTAALVKPGSKSRNERGALAVSQFRAISTLVWHRDHVV